MCRCSRRKATRCCVPTTAAASDTAPPSIATASTVTSTTWCRTSSPASTVRTPTLFLAGESDIRVPPAQSIEMYRALKSLNVPTHLYIAPREGHTWVDLRHQIFKANAELEWFEKYALGRTYTWEKPP